jgi:hypothetical protein
MSLYISSILILSTCTTYLAHPMWLLHRPSYVRRWVKIMKIHVTHFHHPLFLPPLSQILCTFKIIYCDKIKNACCVVYNLRFLIILKYKISLQKASNNSDHIQSYFTVTFLLCRLEQNSYVNFQGKNRVGTMCINGMIQFRLDFTTNVKLGASSSIVAKSRKVGIRDPMGWMISSLPRPSSQNRHWGLFRL